MSETIKVSKETKRSLLKVAAKLQASTRKRIDFDEAIQHLVSLSDKRPILRQGIWFGSKINFGRYEKGTGIGRAQSEAEV